MDAGFEVSWPARKKPDEISAPAARDEPAPDLGDVAFFAEYQNAPLVEQQGEQMLTAGEIARSSTG
jgi:hypothetical protein